MRRSVPLIGLEADGLLPGEQRTFGASELGKPTLEALADRLGASVCVVTITSKVELPSLVAQRFATVAIVTNVAPKEATLMGQSRVQILSATGREGVYTAEVLEKTAPLPSVEELIAGTRSVLDALASGALPEVPEWEMRFGSVVLGLVRALGGAEGLTEAQRHPPAEALLGLTRTLTARTPAVKAAAELETAIGELARVAQETPNAKKMEFPSAMKQRLWSQVVEIQKRLDVYDPGVGKEGDDLGLLQRRLMQAGMPKLARETAKRELRLLRGMSTSHHDHATYYSHLQFMARLPWQPDPPPPIDLEGVSAALDRDHFGLDKAKTRVLEYLSVRALGGESASMVLCLSGPPGVGKTSIATSIARALGRTFVRVPLGGVHDESEIRGHRLSFTAASAGRILKGLAQARSASAVMLLDEVDKIGTDRQRSPAAALLEVLDPEQNTHFQDNYLGVPFDLSHVLFIATANETGAMHATLRDRMEPIEIEGYTTQEKAKIAETHLVGRVAREVGLPDPPRFEDGMLPFLIERYTREAGVRQLKRTISRLYRARALSLVRSGEPKESAKLEPFTQAEIEEVLGPALHLRRSLPEAASVGVAVGLSVSSDGGSILFLEVGLLPGKGKLRLTGRLGEVMRESVQTALSYARMHSKRLEIEGDRLSLDVHLHAPEGAVPKDGPSAGIAVLVALVSAFRGVAPAADVALTGEMSLAGHVLRVGGVRAKLLAAERAGVGRVILPADNVADMPRDIGVTVIPVRTVEEVLEAAFG